MARRRKKSEGGGRAAWLVTFSDLMTLLLTFFVLLLSMASMDTTVINRISAQTASLSPIPRSGPGRVPERIQLIVKLLKDPYNVLEKPKRLKDLLFPDDVLPKEMVRGELDKNLEILAHPEGVVIVLTDSLLYAEGSSELSFAGKTLLDALTPVIQAVNADVNIGGHAAPTADAEEEAKGYELSFLRAAGVLEHFLHRHIAADRFSLSGYGADKPLHAGEAPEDGHKNRRVEIFIKSAPRVGGYM